MGKLKTTAAGSATDDRMRNKRRAEDVDGDGVKVSKYEDQAPEQAKTFMQHDFGLDRRLIKAVAKMGFVYPTLVQSQCIPLALKGKDLLVRLFCFALVIRRSRYIALGAGSSWSRLNFVRVECGRAPQIADIGTQQSTGEKT